MVARKQSGESVGENLWSVLIEWLPISGHLTVPAVDKSDGRMPLERGGAGLKSLRHEHVVRIEEEDAITASEMETCISSCGQACVRLPMVQDSRKASRDGLRRISGPVVHNDDFLSLARLRDRRVDRVREIVRLIEAGDGYSFPRARQCTAPV
jgi:hypothetical protein